MFADLVHPIYSLPNWWIAQRELTPGDPNFGLPDHLSLPYRHLYFMDVASFSDLLSINGTDDVIPEKIAPVLEWMTEHLKGDWRIASHTNAKSPTSDCRVHLWFSFDVADDAMLSRITWPALRHRKHDNP